MLKKQRQMTQQQRQMILSDSDNNLEQQWQMIQNNSDKLSRTTVKNYPEQQWHMIQNNSDKWSRTILTNDPEQWQMIQNNSDKWSNNATATNRDDRPPRINMCTSYHQTHRRILSTTQDQLRWQRGWIKTALSCSCLGWSAEILRRRFSS